MNNPFKRIKTTKLARRLIRKMALVIAVSLALSFIIAFAIFWPHLRNDAQERAIAISEYITDSINEIFLNLEGYADYMISSSVLRENLITFEQTGSPDSLKVIQSLLFSIIPASSNVRAVILEWSGESFQAGDVSQQDWEQLQSSLFPINQNSYSKSIWSALYTAEVNEHTKNTVFRVSQGTIDDQPYKLTVIYNADSLIERIDWLTKNIYTGYSLAILDGEDYVLFFESDETANIAAHLENLGELKQLETKNDFNGYYYFAAIPASNWIFCGFMSSAFFNSGLVPFLILLFIICMVLALLVFVFLIPSVNTTIAPLKKLEETMKIVSESGPDFYSEIQSDDEIGSLSDVFNDMLDDMRINTEEKIEREKREQLLHYSLMLSQINSHFFYNTLNMISSLARQKRYEDVLQANTALTTIFQDCLRSLKTGMTDTVIQEYDIVNCYWTIAALDPQNKAKLIWDIPEDLWEENIPKNIIQPIIENALFHGLDDPQTGIKSGWIKISFQKIPEQLILTISNNGLPIVPETLNKLNTYQIETDLMQDKHIGILNIKRRLHFLYGETATLEIDSAEITRFTIRIPDIHENKESIQT